MILYVTLIILTKKLNSNMGLEGSSILTNAALGICRHAYCLKNSLFFIKNFNLLRMQYAVNI